MFFKRKGIDRSTFFCSDLNAVSDDFPTDCSLRRFRISRFSRNWSRSIADFTWFSREEIGESTFDKQWLRVVVSGRESRCFHYGLLAAVGPK